MNKLLSSTLALAAAVLFVLPVQAQDAKPGDKTAGATKAQMCIGCHNIPRYQASFPEVYKVPKIAGQNAKYIVSALAAYRKGDRKHPSMRAIATTLSDQDMADIAAFYEDLGKQGESAPAKLAEQPPRVGRKTAGPGELRLLPRRQLQRADRSELSEDRRPVRRLPVRRPEGLPDHQQSAHRPQQRHHDGDGAAVLAPGTARRSRPISPRCPAT